MLNESVLYEIVSTKGVLFKLSEKFNRVLNDGTEITLRSVILKDNTDTIPVTFYGKYGDDRMDGNCYILKKIQVNKYIQERQLRSTSSSVIPLQVLPKIV